MWNTDKWTEVWAPSVSHGCNIIIIIRKWFYLSIGRLDSTCISEDLGALLGLHLAMTSLAVQSSLVHKNCGRLQLLTAGAAFETPLVVSSASWDNIDDIEHLLEPSLYNWCFYLQEIPQHHRHVSHTWGKPPVPDPPSSWESPAPADTCHLGVPGPTDISWLLISFRSPCLHLLGNIPTFLE